MALSLIELKILAAFTIIIISAIGLLLPRRVKSHPRVLSTLNVFSGGVFLGAGWLHLLADSAIEFNHQHIARRFPNEVKVFPQEVVAQQETFPWVFLCFAGGFISMVVIEQVAASLGGGHSHTHDDTSPCGSNIDNKGRHENNNQPHSMELLTDPPAHDRNNNIININIHNHEEASPSRNDVNSEQEQREEEQPRANEHNNIVEGLDAEVTPTEHHHETNLMMIISLYFALSYHSIIEGLVLGSSGKKTINSIIIAILLHKGLEAFAMGIALLRNAQLLQSTLKYSLFALGFVVMTPIGILLGSFLPNLNPLAVALISAVGSGTFTYIAIVEVLGPELLSHPAPTKRAQYQWVKMAALSAGFGLMAMLAVWV